MKKIITSCLMISTIISNVNAMSFDKIVGIPVTLAFSSIGVKAIPLDKINEEKIKIEHNIDYTNKKSDMTNPAIFDKLFNDKAFSLFNKYVVNGQEYFVYSPTIPLKYYYEKDEENGLAVSVLQKYTNTYKIYDFNINGNDISTSGTKMIALRLNHNDLRTINLEVIPEDYDMQLFLSKNKYEELSEEQTSTLKRINGQLAFKYNLKVNIDDISQEILLKDVPNFCLSGNEDNVSESFSSITNREAVKLKNIDFSKECKSLPIFLMADYNN